MSETVHDDVASTVSAKESNGLWFRAQFGQLKKQVDPVFVTLLFEAWWSAGKRAKQQPNTTTSKCSAKLLHEGFCH
jgi:hypothetical protein